MANLLEKLLSTLSLIREGNSEPKSSKNNLSLRILDAAEKGFEKSIEDVSGDKMMFHQVIKIWLHTDDYYRNQTLYILLKGQIVDRLYKVINRNLKDYKNQYDHTKNWTIKFLLCEQKIENMPDNFAFNKGSVFVTTDFEEIIREKSVKENEERAAGDIRGTLVNLNNNKGKPLNLSTTFLLNFKEIDEDTFPFDKNKVEIPENPGQKLEKIQQLVNPKNTHESGNAKLTYNLGNGIQTCMMKTDQLEICGKNDARNKKELNGERCILDLDLSPARYAKIFCKSQGFAIGAYGKLYLNNSEIEEWKDGKLKIYSLSNHSTIKLQTSSGKEISIKFESLL